jgi:hypothetical protein
MAFRKRLETDLLALGIAAAVTALLTLPTERPNPRDSNHLSAAQARAESAAYLDGPASEARLHRAAGRWAVTDGRTTAWLDARTGELVELSFAAPR